MTDKDARVRIQIRNGGNPIDFSVITGKVLDVRQIAESATHVSGGGGGTTVSSQTVNWTTDTIFLKYDGGEMSFKVRNNPMPVRAGNRLSVVYGSWPREKTGRLVGLYNYDTNKGYLVGTISPNWRIPFALIWGIPSLFYLWYVGFGQGMLAAILGAALFAAVFSTIPWIAYRVWIKRKIKKRLQTIFNKIVGCLSQSNDLKTLEAA